MFRDVRPNKDLEHRVIYLLLSRLNGIIVNITTTIEDRRCMVMVVSYLIITSTTLMRGNKVFLVVSHGIITNAYYGKEVEETHPCMVISLLVIIKNQVRGQIHMHLLAFHTSSDFKIRRWVEHLIKILTTENSIQGLTFFQANGYLLKSESLYM